MAPKGPQFPWDDKLDLILVKLVRVMDAHVCAYGAKGAKWNELNDRFFVNSEVKHLKSVHYVKGNHTKVKSRFEKLMEGAVKLLGDGNTSGKEGDLSELYRILKELHDEKERPGAIKEAEAEEKAETKVKLEGFETTCLNPEQPTPFKTEFRVKRELDSGSSSDGSRHKYQRFDTLSLIHDLVNVGLHVTKKEDKNLERNMLQKLSDYVNEKKITVDDVIEAMKLRTDDSMAAKECLERVGLDLVLGLYCNPGANFDSNIFTMHLRMMDWPLIFAFKMYFLCEKWRKEIEEQLSNSVAYNMTCRTPSPVLPSHSNLFKLP